ncbi:hypothetical protein DL762_001870 [Monosporascus cannonballus]|uniref:Uncharacterized protein n=1 Tax=Monosporascus cannonballus TaxID=155416 RepID=A0ABY0HIB9_9PEZI|nr:hypothetical protein DL762_001870 [Monosporascus cannonballus]
MLGYYVRVAACVFASKRKWLRDPCLAAALVLPATAAVHSIVLTAAHVDGAVDMDVYGAFQLCSIGVLAAPVTVQFSRTYVFDPARHLMFLWSSLLFIDSTSNIYVIPSPFYLSFGTGVLLAAACCIPAVFSLVCMWNKILEINWKKKSTTDADDKYIEGTNGATIGGMNGVNSVIRRFLSVIEVPMFGAGVLAIVIMGELNFWSTPVRYQTERITGIGQWGPIVGTLLAALRSLYVVLASYVNNLQDPESGGPAQGTLIATTPPPIASSRSSYTRPGSIISQNRDSGDRISINSHFRPDTTPGHQQTWVSRDAGYRRKVAKSLLKINSYFETAAPGRFDVSEFRRGKANGFPEVPGEGYRNPTLRLTKKQYKQNRDAENREAEKWMPGLSRQHSGSTPSPAPAPNLVQVYSSPAIVLSSDAGTTWSNDMPDSNESSTGSSSAPLAPTPGLSGPGE